MARKRDPNRDEAFKIWKQHNGKITNRAIAEQLSIDEKKVAVWKQRDKWNVIQQSENNVVQKMMKSETEARPLETLMGKAIKAIRQQHLRNETQMLSNMAFMQNK